MGCCSSNAVEKPSQNAKISFIKRRQGAVQDFYEILETLGKGSFGVVHQVRERKSKLVRAMKEVRKSSLSEGQEMQILNEIEILSQLDHPNIMKIYEVIESQQCYYIICELLIGGEVFIKLKHKGSFSEAVSASYIKDVLSGVYYSHSMGIVHNDLKPENLLLENKTEEAQLKIIDFGIARSLKHGPLTGLVGSIYYIAPEILTGTYNEKIDLWSIGVILYFFLSGTLPFIGKGQELTDKIKLGRYDVMSKSWKNISKEAKDLLKGLLEVNPLQRLSAEQALKHPWFSQQISKRGEMIDESMYSNLKHFQKANHLATSILVYISNQMLTNQEESTIGLMFKELDADGNGKLSKEELSAACSKFGLFTLEDIDLIFDNCDIDKSGFIDYSEFLTVSMTWNKVLKQEKVKMIFDFFNAGKNGNLSLDMLKSYFPEATEQDWKEFLAEIDVNGDGDISLDEFRDYLTKYIQG